MFFPFTLSLLVTSALAANHTIPPPGAITVGSSGTHATIQEAINSLDTESSSAQSIFIYAGTYKEKVIIPALKDSLTIYGYTTNTSSYRSNVVNIEYDSTISSAGSDEASATVQNIADNSKLYNINIKNTYGKGCQAVALATFGTQQGYYGVGLYGFQDTLLAQIGTQVYAKCYIEGAVDFLFGQHARVWIDSSDIRVSAGIGALTAHGRATSTDPSYYVINNSTVAATSSGSATPGSVYLGRPWREYARVVIQRTHLSSVINSAGWKPWSLADSRTSNVIFGEYDNTGPGASGKRANFATKLGSAVSISTILGTNYSGWVDASYLV